MKKNIIFISLCIFITSCTSKKYQFSFSTDIELKNADSDFYELFSTVEQGGSGLFNTYDEVFPIFSENNYIDNIRTVKPSFLGFFLA